MDGREFIKMHGLGNDFVIIDARRRALALAPEAARAIADRRTGVGCDQVILIDTPGEGTGLDAAFRIHNADGGEVAACGNAARCVAWLVMGETGREAARLATRAGPLEAWRAGPERVRIDMGRPAFDWRSIPLAEACETDALPLEDGPLRAPSALSMGNPHAVFFVEDAAAVDLAAIGPRLERHPIFPERANIGVVQVLDRARLRVRVWERGAGLTLACGTGACAAAVAAARRGLAGRRLETVLDGGSLEIEWREDGHVMMTGPVAVSFRGRMEPGLLP